MNLNSTKILLVNYLGKKGAGPMLTYNFVTNLLDRQNNIKIIVLLSRHIENKFLWEKLENIEIYFIPTYTNKLSFIFNTFFVLPFLLLYIKLKFSKFVFDNIFVPMVTPWSYFFNRFSFKNKKIVVTVHDPIQHIGEKSLFLKFLLKLDYHNADYLIVLSQKFIPVVSNLFAKSPDNIFYFKLPIDDYYLNLHNSKKDRSNFLYKENKFNLLFFGRFSLYKGLETLASAYKLLVKDHKDQFTLTVAGSGDFSSFSKYFIDLPNFTLINKWFDDNSISELFMGENIIVILPYLEATQSGIIPLASSFYLPIISSKVGGLDEQISDFNTGILFEPKNVEDLKEKILLLVNDNSLRLRIIQNLKNSNQNNSWQIFVEKYLNFFINT
jgi:glycosyltransferase involved in cell wall biosynthesis